MRHLLIFCLAPLGLLMLGCSKAAPTSDDSSVDDLNLLFDSYRAATAKLGHPPRSQTELAPQLPAGTDVDALFQRFVIIWGTDPRESETAMANWQPLIVGYAKQSHGGMRLVATVMGVYEMPEEEFQNGNFPPGHKP